MTAIIGSRLDFVNLCVLYRLSADQDSEHKVSV